MKTSKSVILSRQDEILSYIQRNNYIKISELAKAFGCPPLQSGAT